MEDSFSKPPKLEAKIMSVAGDLESHFQSMLEMQVLLKTKVFDQELLMRFGNLVLEAQKIKDEHGMLLKMQNSFDGSMTVSDIRNRYLRDQLKQQQDNNKRLLETLKSAVERVQSQNVTIGDKEILPESILKLIQEAVFKKTAHPLNCTPNMLATQILKDSNEARAILEECIANYLHLCWHKAYSLNLNSKIQLKKAQKQAETQQFYKACIFENEYISAPIQLELSNANSIIPKYS